MPSPHGTGTAEGGVLAISLKAVTLVPMGSGHFWAPRSAPGGVCDAWLMTTEYPGHVDRVVYGRYSTAREIGNEHLRAIGRGERFPDSADDWSFAIA